MPWCQSRMVPPVSKVSALIFSSMSNSLCLKQIYLNFGATFSVSNRTELMTRSYGKAAVVHLQHHARDA